MLNLRRVDGFLLFIFIFLMILGNLTVYTSSYFVAKRLTGNPYYFFIRQLIWTVPSFLSLIFFANYDYNNLRKITKPMILLTFILLILVFIPGIGKESGGARRWINLRLFDFNPSEFAKLSIIIYLSHILTKKKGKIEDFTFGLLPPLLLVSAIFFIILMHFSRKIGNKLNLKIETDLYCFRNSSHFLFPISFFLIVTHGGLPIITSKPFL